MEEATAHLAPPPLMQAEPEFALILLLRTLSERRRSYLLVGRWAVAQRSPPVVTADYDFWIPPRERRRFQALVAELFDADLPPESQRDKPIVIMYAGIDKVDCLSMETIVNEEGQQLRFDEVHARSELKREPDGSLLVRIPTIDDLIALKKFRQEDSMKRLRDEEDIRYLSLLKNARG